MLPPPRRYEWIDGLRGIAALAVVIFHYHHFYLVDIDRTVIPPVETFPYAVLLKGIYLHGHYAVQVFWVISGFVFAHVYLHRSTGIRAFSVARLARLYPLHLATLLIVAGLQALSLGLSGHWLVYGNNDWRHFGLQLVLASNSLTFSRGLSFNGPIWSVSLEFAIYFVFFASLPLLRRWPVPGVLALAVACLVIASPPVSWHLRIVTSGVFDCGAYFFAGVAVWIVMAHQRTVGARIARLAGAVTFLIAMQHLLGRDLPWLLPGAMTLIASLAELERRHPQPPASLVWLGALSFAVYLVHVPLQIAGLLVADLGFSGARGWADSASVLPVYLAATLALAHVIHIRFEHPVGAWLRRTLMGRPAPAPVPGS